MKRNMRESLKISIKKKKPSLQKEDGSPKTNGELISEVTGGANLIDSKQTWELASEKR